MPGFYFKRSNFDRNLILQPPGKTIEKSSLRPETQSIIEVLKSFEGHISQMPPKLSAIKINESFVPSFAN